jgi:hypothetical protein
VTGRLGESLPAPLPVEDPGPLATLPVREWERLRA